MLVDVVGVVVVVWNLVLPFWSYSNSFCWFISLLIRPVLS